MNPFLSYGSSGSSDITVNSIRPNIRDNIVVPLSSLPDTFISNVSNHNMLLFSTDDTDSNSNKWKNYSVTGATINDVDKTITLSGGTLDDMSDCTITNAVDNDVLTFSNTKWINSKNLNLSGYIKSNTNILSQDFSHYISQSVYWRRYFIKSFIL